MTSKKDLSLSDNFDLHISSVIVIQRFDLAILKRKKNGVCEFVSFAVEGLTWAENFCQA